MSLEITVEGDEGLGRTKEGLIVPKEYTIKKENWFRDEWKKIARWARSLAKDHDVDVMFFCKRCGEAKRPSTLISFTEDEQGFVKMSCECTERTVKL